MQSHRSRQNVLSAGGVLIESQWQFNSKRGAVLLMHKPRTTRVPDGFFAESIHIPILRNKCVVNQVWDCPGYFMYLSGKGEYLRPLLFCPDEIDWVNAVPISERESVSELASERQASIRRRRR